MAVLVVVAAALVASACSSPDSTQTHVADEYNRAMPHDSLLTLPVPDGTRDGYTWMKGIPTTRQPQNGNNPFASASWRVAAPSPQLVTDVTRAALARGVTFARVFCNPGSVSLQGGKPVGDTNETLYLTVTPGDRNKTVSVALSGVIPDKGQVPTPGQTGPPPPARPVLQAGCTASEAAQVAAAYR